MSSSSPCIKTSPRTCRKTAQSVSLPCVTNAAVTLLTSPPPDFSALQGIAKDRTTDSLMMAITLAKSDGHYSVADLAAAYKAIGCTGDAPEELSEDMVQSAFSNCLETTTADASRKGDLRDACLLIARSRESELLLMLVNSVVEEKPKMDLVKAYRMFSDSPGETIDSPELLIVVYGIRVRFRSAPSSATRRLALILSCVGTDRGRSSADRHVQGGSGHHWRAPKKPRDQELPRDWRDWERRSVPRCLLL